MSPDKSQSHELFETVGCVAYHIDWGCRRRWTNFLRDDARLKFEIDKV